MPILVHLADEKESARIKNNGIKVGKGRQGVFCMPVLQNFYLSHQWLRELKRSGATTFVGIYFKVDRKTKVYFGRYNEEHKHIELGEAIKVIQNVEDPLGYEIIIDRKIGAKEIHKIKSLPQNIGWRYMPAANGRKPCGCDFCIRGSIKANRIRERLSPREKRMPYREILEKLKVENDLDEIDSLFCEIRSKRRNSNPAELLFLLDKNADSIEEGLALTLRYFKHKATKTILLGLLGKENDSTREYAADSLLELYGKEVLPVLEQIADSAIQTALSDWREIN